MVNSEPLRGDEPFLILKVLGIWLIVDALGSWLYDIKKQLEEDSDQPHMIVHIVRFVRVLIGTFHLTV
ncbi:MAG: hypothetical protein QXF26_09610 [Candidatus Bathyarchaeia archaeon]